MSIIAVIPSRYASTRLPGKPLVDICGKTMVQRVYEQVRKVELFDDVLVATDDQRIFDAVTAFGGKAVMTSEDCPSGTDRLIEVATANPADIYVNIQGDEPFIAPKQIETLIRCFENKDIDIATLVKPFSANDSIDILENPNSPKVVLDAKGEAIYFSRSVVPYLRGVERNDWLKSHTFYKHIGIYAFRAKALNEVTALEQTPLEQAESLEQLRWLESGYRIKIEVTNTKTFGIDTPEDLQRAEQYLRSQR